MAKIRINNQKREIKINLNKGIYPGEAIKAAADTFKSIAKVECGEEVILKPREKKADLKEIALAFCDYVLGLIGNKQF